MTFRNLSLILSMILFTTSSFSQESYYESEWEERVLDLFEKSPTPNLNFKVREAVESNLLSYNPEGIRGKFKASRVIARRYLNEARPFAWMGLAAFTGYFKSQVGLLTRSECSPNQSGDFSCEAEKGAALIGLGYEVQNGFDTYMTQEGFSLYTLENLESGFAISSSVALVSGDYLSAAGLGLTYTLIRYATRQEAWDYMRMCLLDLERIYTMRGNDSKKAVVHALMSQSVRYP